MGKTVTNNYEGGLKASREDIIFAFLLSCALAFKRENLCISSIWLDVPLRATASLKKKKRYTFDFT